MLTLAKEYEERTINNQERELLKKFLESCCYITYLNFKELFSNYNKNFSNVVEGAIIVNITKMLGWSSNLKKSYNSS